MSGSRGRITIVEVVFFAASIAVLAFVTEPMYSILDQYASELGTGEAFLFRMVVPGLIMTVLVLVYTTAVGGHPE